MLTHELVEGARTHASCERSRESAVAIGAIVEEGAHAQLVRRAQDLTLEDVPVCETPELPGDVALLVGDDDVRCLRDANQARECD